MDKISRVTEGQTDDEQRGFKSGRGYVYQILTLKESGEKARQRNQRAYISFLVMEKAYDKG